MKKTQPAFLNVLFFLSYFYSQYAAKEFQQALDILDSEEPASKKLLDRSGKEDNGTPESTKDWDMSPASVSLKLTKDGVNNWGRLVHHCYSALFCNVALETHGLSCQVQFNF